jgi:phosphatidylinositol dimannoside acyltransferase
VIGFMKLILHSPERPLWWIAARTGGLSYRFSRSRRDHARKNLRRIVEWMAANGVGAEKYRLAATDTQAFEELLREAFRQHAYYSVEMARAPKCTPAFIRDRMVNETAELETWLGERKALIVIGLHFGAIEMPGFFLVQHIGDLVTPMESVANPRIQRYIFTTRAAVGTRIVTLADAPRALKAALHANEPVGLVADRDITGGGTEVEFFGATAHLPLGPALMAVESGAPVYMGAVRRSSPGHYRGRLLAVPVPDGTTRRERVRAMLAEEARLFEQLISDAPEQWLALFHPVWPDLEASPVKSEEPA